MKVRLLATLGLPAMAISVILAGCGAQGASGGGSGDSASNGCLVHLYDGGDFEGDNVVINKPGRYANLKNLPSAKQNWTDEADSFKVGSAATVKVWGKTDFQGSSKTYRPGSKEASADPEPSSLELSCR
ncbi:MAG: hypothetical protein ACRESR_09150 [Gammaproteobacteria bacterium]